MQQHTIVSPRAAHQVVGGYAAAAASYDDDRLEHIVMDIDTSESNNNSSSLKATAASMKTKKQLSGDASDMDDNDDASERSKLLSVSDSSAAMKAKELDDSEASSSEASMKAAAQKTSYVAPQTVMFWLSMWFIQNIGVTFWNKKALNVIRLPVTLTFVHMICNTIGACLYIYAYRGIERKPLKPGQQSLMVYFSIIFVSNIITGNWSLGLVSISFNQVMRALVPGVVVGLSMLILGKSYSTERKLSLIPVAYGVYLACTGDNSCTVFGFFITVVAVIFAGLKAVLSNKFLSGDMKLHPVDLILHQAPLSALWCFFTIFLSGEYTTLVNNLDLVPAASFWYLVTGAISFLLNITSFYANKVTSPVTLCVCGNMKQIVVIVMAIVINNDVFTTQKSIGIAIVTLGGVAYAYISTKEMNQSAVPVRPPPPAQAVN